MTSGAPLQEHDHEAQPGLPQALPDGERIVWQGVPEWTSLAVRTFHVRKIAIYFGFLMCWKLFAGVRGGEDMSVVYASTAFLGVLAALSVGMLTWFAWLMARNSLYTITSQRVVMRIGVALTMTVNLPFKDLKDAALRQFANGTGDITLTLMDGQRVSYVVLWPHCRFLHPFLTRPVLRGVPNAEHVARRFAHAVADASTGDVESGVLGTDVEPTGQLAPAR